MVVEDDAAASFALACAGGAVPHGELVASAWAFDAEIEHVLLVDHARFRVLIPPGGRVEAGEDPRAAALRELLEETGLVGTVLDERPALLDLWRDVRDAGEPIETYGLAFLVTVDPRAPLTSEPDQPASWVPLGSPPDRAHPRHWRRLNEAAARLRVERT